MWRWREITMIDSGTYAWATLGVALLFAAVFLAGGSVHRPGRAGRRRFLSFAAGISVGYTFVHVLPGLSRVQAIAAEAPALFRVRFPEYSVYLWAMAGFLIFYGLETLAVRARPAPAATADSAESAENGTRWRPWVHIGGFALYAWLLTHLLVWQGRSALALGLYTVAMGLHLFPIADHLSREYAAVYRRRGAPVLALAALAGWASGLMLTIPLHALATLVAVVAGGVIVNAMIAELPKEKEGRYGAFLTGAVVYTALLLVLSHFEKGG
jgi:hypothetical protein